MDIYYYQIKDIMNTARMVMLPHLFWWTFALILAIIYQRVKYWIMAHAQPQEILPKGIKLSVGST